MSDVTHEINMYQLFSNNEHIIQLRDKHIIAEKDGTKSVYLFFPYYKVNDQVRGRKRDLLELHREEIYKTISIRIILTKQTFRKKCC